MTSLDQIQASLASRQTIRDVGNGIEIISDCLYPSMSAVVVSIELGNDSFVAHDAGRALDEASAANALPKNPARIMRAAVRPFGLHLSEALSVSTGPVPLDELPAAVLLVANASRDAAFGLIQSYTPSMQRDARVLVEEVLDRRFARSRVHRDFLVSGVSTKMHRFDFGVELPHERTLLLDVVLPDASSINAAFVSNFDVRGTGKTGLVQRLVFDEERRWPSSEIALLQSAAPLVALGDLDQVMERLAA